jgi:hypothetical protein
MHKTTATALAVWSKMMMAADVRIISSLSFENKIAQIMSLAGICRHLQSHLLSR